jgi:hypothetical protein
LIKIFVLRLINRLINGSIISATVLSASIFTFAQTQPAKSADQPGAAAADSLATVSVNKEKDDAVTSNSNAAVPKLVNSAAAPSKQKAQSDTSGSGWEFSFAPYLYMTGLSGTVGARGRTTEVDLSFGDVISHLDVGIMGTFEAKKDRFLIINDVVWTKLSEKRDTPGDLYSTAKIGVNLFSWTPEVGYRLYDSEGGSFDVIGGLRVTSVENNLNFGTGTLPGFDVSARKSWAAPIIGGHGVANLTSKFFLSTVFDVGGGFGTHFTGQFYGGAGYKITPKIALIGGYRYLNNNFSDSEGFTFDAAMNGILVGAKFKF